MGGDCVIPACRDEISILPAGTDFTLRLHGKSNYMGKFLPGSTEKGSRLAGMKPFTCNRSRWFPAKRYRVSSWPTGIMCSPPKWNHWILRLKELRNCILCTIPVWSLFCSVRIYIILHFLPIILVKLDFCFSVF